MFTIISSCGLGFGLFLGLKLLLVFPKIILFLFYSNFNIFKIGFSIKFELSLINLYF